MVVSVTDQTQFSAAPAPVENVGRGAAFALLAIPAAIIVFAVIAGLFQIISGIVAIVVPYIAAWLYKKGAGAPLTRAGWGPFILVSAAAVVIGTFTGIVAATYAGYLGDGGLLSESFLTTLGYQFTRYFGDTIIPILIGLGLGGVGIAGVIQTERKKAAAEAAAEASASAVPVAPTASGAPAVPVAPTAAAPAAPVAPTAPAIPLAPNQPSPGVILNGKPIDPNKK